jgi:membrane-bound lytic murein transglycosylase B
MSTVFSSPLPFRKQHAFVLPALLRGMGLLIALCLLAACAAAHEPLPSGGYPVTPKEAGSGSASYTHSPPSASAPVAYPADNALPSAYTPPTGTRYISVSLPSAPQSVSDVATAEPAPLVIAQPAPRRLSSLAPRPVPAPQAKKTTQAPKARPVAKALPAPQKPSLPPVTAASRVSAGLADFKAPPASAEVADCWEPLVDRLKKDPKVTPEVVNYFCNLPTYSPDPMGAKVKELFTNAFLRKKGLKPSGPPRRIYKNVVTAANVAKCSNFLSYYKSTFAAVEKKYAVPKEILVSLLFVETRLGDVIGKENAFWSLACMAAATTPEQVQGGLAGLPITAQHAAWLQDKLSDKSEWAYKELRALLKFCYVQQLDPHGMPGSVYGAIGICQFMPSNLVPYGDDGDGDGLVNLFSVPDAVFSAALYLTKHGWREGISVDRQRQILKRYNNLNIYANTILALAASIRTGRLYDGPPDMVQASAQATKKAGKRK